MGPWGWNFKTNRDRIRLSQTESGRIKKNNTLRSLRMSVAFQPVRLGIRPRGF